MAIDVVADDYHGKVIIRDQKSDGSAVLLACEELPTGPATGPAAVPEPEDEKGTDSGFYPIGGTQFVGVLQLDMTDAPSGLSTFDSHRFCEAAVTSLREGVHRVRFGRQEAEAFGYRETRGRGMTAGA